MSESFSTVSRHELRVESVSAQLLHIGKLLRARNWTVSCAESCTGGGIAFALTSVAGSSDWFEQSWVTYSNQAKSTLIGVREDTLLMHGAVSEQVVAEMVTGTVAASGAQCAIAVSGIAGPGGGSKEKPVGTVWFGFQFDQHIVTRCQKFQGDRQTIRAKAIDYAIIELHHWLVDNQT